MTPTIQDFVDGFIADRNALTVEQCKFAVEAWDETRQAIDNATSLSIAPSDYCNEVDLPGGSTWVEVLAAAMDGAPGINGTDHLRLLQLVMKQAELATAEF